MRQVTETKTIVKYNELNEVQKTKVNEKFRYINTSHDWYEYVYEDAERLLALLGFSEVKIQFSGFSCQGDGASFTGTFKVPKTVKELKDRIKAFKNEAPNEKLFEYGAMRFTNDEKLEEHLKVFRISNHYAHSGTVSSDNVDLTNFVRDFSNELYKRLEREYDYLTSDEAIQETIECNDYEFELETLSLF